MELTINWDAVKNALITGWEWIKNVFRENPILAFVTGPIGAIIGLIANWDDVKAALLAGWQIIKDKFADNPIVEFLSRPGGFIDSLIDGFNRLVDKAKWAWEQIKKFAGGISLPGLPGFSLGGYTGAGGVNQAAGIVHKGEVVFSQRDVAKFGGWRMVEAIRRGGAGMLALAADKLGAGAQGRPVLSGVVPVPSGGFARPAAGAVSVGGDTVSIHVHAAPGMSERALADKVSDILNRRDAAKRRRANSSFSDRD
ncbi:phage tail tape measure protein [Neisseria wadsworthii]|uniref:hypothetical protein n=1 Tax=Neisseria wadsworthii TaxID=607711 RepID=UPI001F2BB670|nr:hypothetical protein [Neisseria wadsworthii]